MRRRLAETGVPQPRVRRGAHDPRGQGRARHGRAPRRAQAGRLRRPARALPAPQPWTTSRRTCTRRSPSRSNEEAIVESFHHGLEVNGLVVARDGEPHGRDALRPAPARTGAASASAIAHVYPSTLFGDRLEEAERVARARRPRARDQGLGRLPADARDRRRGAADRGRRARPRRADGPGRRGGRWASTSSRSRCSRRSASRCRTSSSPHRFEQPLAISFLTAEPGPLPVGRVRSRDRPRARARVPRASRRSRSSSGRARHRPVARDGDRKGFVIALGATNIEAVERAEAAATLIDVDVE